ncbi:MAG TPA: hypothetical protein VMR06_08365 [Dokdonella sp.]|uniref:hypothetical protein n=1 Tax=Dokdonella sp. TaxID=2291710 RepID=UPI002C600E01|nr:hypothetical protein [Dokdonella sp.]HUD41997.1 hypothetical protein [Dokdonella sp.]
MMPSNPTVVAIAWWHPSTGRVVLDCDMTPERRQAPSWFPLSMVDRAAAVAARVAPDGHHYVYATADGEVIRTDGGGREINGSRPLRAIPYYYTPPTVDVDVEQMLEACVPGGSICDPQAIADEIRRWYDARRSDVHSDDLAVDRFARAMKDKLAAARAKGRGGWDDKADCTQEHLSNLLRQSVEKGDPRDVANFCMFLHDRGEAILEASTGPLPIDEWFDPARLPARDEFGLVTHPDLSLVIGHDDDEIDGSRFRALLDGLGFDIHSVSEEMPFDAENVLWFDPQPPAGQGWRLVTIFDTEDSEAVAWFARPVLALPHRADGSSGEPLFGPPIPYKPGEELQADVVLALLGLGCCACGAEIVTRESIKRYDGSVSHYCVPTRRLTR